jgi:flagellar basal body-associated protein FliL
MQEENKIETKSIVKQQTNKKEKKIQRRVIVVLVFIFIMAIFAYVSYRGSYLETIEIGENFKQVFTRKFKIFIFNNSCQFYYFIYCYITY